MNRDTYVRAMNMPLWEDSGIPIPEGFQLRKSGDTAALVRSGTSKVIGFVPSRFDVKSLPALLERLA